MIFDLKTSCDDVKIGIRIEEVEFVIVA